MAINNKIELEGILGSDAKVIEKNGKTFVALSLATRDSYPVEENGQTVWKNKESIWHDILVFRPIAVSYAKAFKKGDIVEVTGSIAYKPIKDAEGYTRKVANIIASYVAKIEPGKKDEPSEAEIAEAVEETARR